MGSQNDYCPRCDSQPYYEGHKDWCRYISELEERIEKLEELLPEDPSANMLADWEGLNT